MEWGGGIEVLKSYCLCDSFGDIERNKVML